MSKDSSCLTADCENPATARTQYCKQCNASIGGWAKRRPAEVLRRRSNLRRFTSRIQDVMSEREIKEK